MRADYPPTPTFPQRLSPAADRARRRLKRCLWRPAGLDLLAIWECGWNDGGCGVLAGAVQRWLGPAVKLVGLWDSDGLEHVVAQIGGYYLDGDGLSTRRCLLQRWRIVEGRPHVQLRLFARADLQAAGIPRYDVVEQELASYLNRWLSADELRALAREGEPGR